MEKLNLKSTYERPLATLNLQTGAAGNLEAWPVRGYRADQYGSVDPAKGITKNPSILVPMDAKRFEAQDRPHARKALAIAALGAGVPTANTEEATMEPKAKVPTADIEEATMEPEP